MTTTVEYSHGYSNLEEWLNSLTHAIGFIAAIVGMVFLLFRADSALTVTAAVLYGVAMQLLFAASSAYHAIQTVNVKRWLKLIDHSAIYLLIAGSYTPFTLVAIGGKIGWIATITIWAMAIIGVVFKCWVRHRMPKTAIATYLVFGWVAVLLIYPLYQALSVSGLWLLVFGGALYSVGVLFYVRKSKKYTHAIWHLFVLAGCTAHYFAVYLYVF